MAQKPRRLGRGLSSLLQPLPPVSVAIPQKQSDQKNTNKNQTNNTNESASGSDSGGERGGDRGGEKEPGRPGQESFDLDTRMQQKGDAHAPSQGRGSEIAVDQIVPNPYQPRRDFDPAAITTLAASILRSGLMQPIIVRPAPETPPQAAGEDSVISPERRSNTGTHHRVVYEIVAGERRWRAAREAGLVTIPAVVRELSDAQAAEWALIENMQREDLNPIERGFGLRALADQFSLSHTHVGQRVGLERSTVANLIRLTELEEDIQQLVADGALSMGHARALLGVPAGDARCKLAAVAAREGWTVRATEHACRERSQNKVRTKDGKNTKNPNTGQSQRESVIADLEKRISASLGTKVTIAMRRKGNQGRILIEFYDLEHFEDLMERMGVAGE